MSMVHTSIYFMSILYTIVICLYNLLFQSFMVYLFVSMVHTYIYFISILYTIMIYLCCLYFRRSWCTQCDGQLLFFIVDILSPEIQPSNPDSPSPHEENIKMAIEQCFYCLFNHPSKRSKAKHLEEHNAETVSYIAHTKHIIPYHKIREKKKKKKKKKK